MKKNKKNKITHPDKDLSGIENIKKTEQPDAEPKKPKEKKISAKMRENAKNNKFVYTDENMAGITIIKNAEEPANSDDKAVKQKEDKIEEIDSENMPWGGGSGYYGIDHEAQQEEMDFIEKQLIEEDKYRECLVDAVEKLKKSRQVIFDAILNLTMAGELKEWNDSIEVGEVYNFSIEVFEGCNDVNVQMLAKVLRNIESTIGSLENINNLGESDV